MADTENRVKITGTWPEGATGTITGPYPGGLVYVEFDRRQEFGLVTLKGGIYRPECLVPEEQDARPDA